jgi:hypothetical protein
MFDFPGLQALYLLILAMDQADSRLLHIKFRQHNLEALSIRSREKRGRILVGHKNPMSEQPISLFQQHYVYFIKSRCHAHRDVHAEKRWTRCVIGANRALESI